MKYSFIQFTGMKAILSLALLTGACFLLLTNTRCKPVAPVKATTPLEQFLEGNKRFASMHPVHPHETKQRVAEIATGQHPKVAVICCSDSRVPPELIFDQGLGDMFVVRTAGNLMGGLEIGSIEYAVEHLGVEYILVMGHKDCGAIKAFIEGGEVPGHINDIIQTIKAEQEISQIPMTDKQLINDYIRANILHGLHQLKQQSVIINDKVRSRQLQLVGACYDLDKGLVEIIRE